ncbi:ribonuclease H-like domain-containing protein [Tanacetum coccineum]
MERQFFVGGNWNCNGTDTDVKKIDATPNVGPYYYYPPTQQPISYIVPLVHSLHLPTDPTQPFGQPLVQIEAPRPTTTPGQATTLPHAFTTRTLHDLATGAWNMDTVTAPSPIPHAFFVSQHTWHQRLGHPRGEVLRRLVSSNFISYNKEKPPVLCHACQLGKHVRLSFVSSSTVISSCFDIIYSDVWTSPILSLLEIEGLESKGKGSGSFSLAL